MHAINLHIFSCIDLNINMSLIPSNVRTWNPHYLVESKCIRRFQIYLHLSLSNQYDNPYDWVLANSKLVGTHSSGIPLNIIFLFAIWQIWNVRNHCLFEHNSNSSFPDSSHTVKTIMSKYSPWFFSGATQESQTTE